MWLIMDSSTSRKRRAMSPPGAGSPPSRQLNRITTGTDPKRPGRLVASKPWSPSAEYSVDGTNPQRTNQNLNVLQRAFLPLANTYTYDKIAPNQIRLLHVMPAGNKNDTLNCMLKVARIEDASTQYEALSYTWGYEEASAEIRIQRPRGRTLKDVGRSMYTEYKTFHVRPHLDSALRYLRDYSSEEPRNIVLWIDAICINQDDEEEKSTQVSKMADIFSHADSVFIWLGEARDDSDTGMDFVKHILNLERQGTLSVTGSSSEQWSAFMSLLRREWFGRRWVVQELALNRNAFLTCGQRAVNWKDFVVALEFFMESFDTIAALYNDSPEFKQKLLSLGDIRAFGAGRMVAVTKDFIRRDGDGEFERLKSLESLVSALGVFEAGDPRDTIYALMSLAWDTPGRLEQSRTWMRHDTDNSVTFQADYKKNTIEVFKDFTAFCIHSSGELNIICRKWAPNRRAKKLTVAERYNYRGRKPPTEEVELPSWIGLLKESAFGMPRAGPQTRIAGENLVSTPDRKQYNASGGRRAEVLFGEDDAEENSDYPDHLPRDRDFSLTPSTHKVTAQETLMRRRGRRSDGTLYARGIRIGTSIEHISHRLYEGLIPGEWLAKAGWQELPNGEQDEQIPDQLWRTIVANRQPNGEQPPEWYHLAMDWAIGRRNGNGDIHTAELIRQGQPPKMVEFLRRAQDVIWDKRFFLLPWEDTQLFGLAPSKAQADDIVCILLGCAVPVILRPVDEDDLKCGYEFIGEAYIYRMMDGEALAAYSRLDVEDLREFTQEFCLV